MILLWYCCFFILNIDTKVGFVDKNIYTDLAVQNEGYELFNIEDAEIQLGAFFK